MLENQPPPELCRVASNPHSPARDGAGEVNALNDCWEMQGSFLGKNITYLRVWLHREECTWEKVFSSKWFQIEFQSTCLDFYQIEIKSNGDYAINLLVVPSLHQSHLSLSITTRIAWPRWGTVTHVGILPLAVSVGCPILTARGHRRTRWSKLCLAFALFCLGNMSLHQSQLCLALQKCSAPPIPAGFSEMKNVRLNKIKILAQEVWQWGWLPEDLFPTSQSALKTSLRAFG